MYTLFCYVRGDDYHCAFEVKIGKEESVAALKKAIKEENKPGFDHISADSLVLWNASVSTNRNLKENVEALNLINDNALQPYEILKDVLPSELKKRTVYIVIDSPPARSLTSFFQLFCYVKGGHYNHAFEVEIGREESVAALKKAIKKKMKPEFDHISAHSLVLWNAPVSFSQNLKEDVEAFNLIDDNALQPLEILKDILPLKLAEKIIYIVVDRPPANLVLPLWLAEIHCKLWGRHDLFGQIFRTANLTKDDFIALQYLLHERNPDRNSRSYVGKDVLAIKSAFLRSRSTPIVKGFGDGLVPRLVFNASQGLAQPPYSNVVDEAAADTDAVADDAMKIGSGSSYIYSDADRLSAGTAGIFPCTFQYMDLTVLKLENNIRVPQLILFRKEWDNMIDFFNERMKGIEGSAVFTGQPGIGKTCLLYSILIHCIIHAQPIVFQDMKGKVFIINDTVRQCKDTPNLPSNDILTLVDADGPSCQPDICLLVASNLRILLASPPRNRKERRWLTQFVEETGAVFVMEPWLREELLVASLFLERFDITLKQFQETSDICGLIPRSCFEAAISHDKLRDARQAIIKAIKETKDLYEAIVDLHSGATIHRAFQIRPSPETRRWNSCLAEPISDWAFSKVMANLDDRSAKAAYKFYCAIRRSTYTLALCGKMFETKLDVFFRTITKPRTFTIHSLDDRDDPSTTFDIEFSSNTEYVTSGAIQHFAGQLASSVRSNRSCYLKPLSPAVPAFNSSPYQHGIYQSDCSPLVGLQVTIDSEHCISIKGLENVPKLLKQQIARLNDLRPSEDRQLIVLFVVPDTSMEASSVKQQIKDEKVEHRYKKTSQFVLALPEKEVFKAKYKHELRKQEP